MRTTRSSRRRRSSVELPWTPGTNVAPMTTKSKMFHPFRKNCNGVGQYEAMRMQSSTMNTATQAALIASSSEPQRSSSSS